MEEKFGTFSAAKTLLTFKTTDGDFNETILNLALNHLTYREVRVREIVSEVIEQLCKNLGIPIFRRVQQRLRDDIISTFDRDQELAEQEADASATLNAEKHTDLRHDTEGWKSLETSYKCLKGLLRGVGTSEVVDEVVRGAEISAEELLAVDVLSTAYKTGKQSMLPLIFKGTKHLNRFVRETSYFLLDVISENASTETLQRISGPVGVILGAGLSDNWSQVRYASSVATRHFLLNLPEEFKKQQYPLLIPRMCLNRHYVAEGVRIYSLETWKQVAGSQGKQILVDNIAETVAFYVEQSEANNHAVREAACACIAELGTHLDRVAVAPHVQALLGALLQSFHDQSWPVRDAACIACGNFVLSHPQECQPQREHLFELWFEHLADNIQSVRMHAAVALSKAMKAYPESVDLVVQKLGEMLPRAKEQKVDSKALPGYGNTTLFGVAARHAHANNAHTHTDQQTFSCGSLAPKLRRGAGCMDHGYSRPKEAWEESDGAVFLLAALCELELDTSSSSSSSFASLVEQFLPTLAEISLLMGYSHFHYLLKVHLAEASCHR